MKKLFILLAAMALLSAACATGAAPQGTTAQKEAAPKEEPKLSPSMDPSVPKLCALTFDDGPDVRQTGLVLDKLKAHNVPAAFFVVGQRLSEGTRPVLKRMLDMGCEINNHSWGYEDLGRATEEQIKDSIGRTTAAIVKYAGVTPKFFRAPNLSTSPTLYAAVGLPFAEGVLGMDWDQSTTAASRAKSVLSGMMDGAIILLHDVQPDPHPTPEALDIIIPELKKRGYEFVTLSELFKRKGVDPASKKNMQWKYVK